MNIRISKVENKIPNTSSLVTTTVLNTKIITKYKISAIFTAKVKQSTLMSKTDFDNKLTSFNRKN